MICTVLVVLNIWAQYITACGTTCNFIVSASANKIPGHKNHGTFEGLGNLIIMHAQRHYAFGNGLLIKEDNRKKCFISTENFVHGMIITCTGYSGHELISLASEPLTIPQGETVNKIYYATSCFNR